MTKGGTTEGLISIVFKCGDKRGGNCPYLKGNETGQQAIADGVVVLIDHSVGPVRFWGHGVVCGKEKKERKNQIGCEARFGGENESTAI